MTHGVLFDLAAIVVAGVLSQWVAWRLHLPSILVLLVVGLLAGPVTGFLHPDETFGELLLPVVSLSVAVILFEGGLSLRIKELRRIGRGLGFLITAGALITWVLIALAAKLIVGLSTPLAVLVGALLIVTGPTVVLPLLRHVRPREPVGSLVKWEGILNDPVGAILAVLVFEALTAGGFQAGTSVALLGLLKMLGIGVLLGGAGAAVLIAVLRFYQVPEYLENPSALMIVVAVYTASDAFHPESGLLSVTFMGIAIANQRWVSVQHIVEFKETLRVLLISWLFILLAARLHMESLSLLGAGSLVFLAALLFVVRPVAVFASTLGSGLSTAEKVFVSWMAPRGIVAAAVASVFALRLNAAGFEGAEILVPLVFLVILGTVVVYGLTAGPLARRLGLAGGPPQGCLLVGGQPWARSLALVLKDAGIPVLLVDNNRHHVAAARMEGVPGYCGNILDESMPDRLPLDGIGKLVALTSNHEVNSLASLHFSEVFGRQEVYQLSAKEDDTRKDDYALSLHLRGRLLFGKEHTYHSLDRRFAAGAEVKKTTLSDEFPLTAFRDRYGEDAVILFVIEDGGGLRVATVEETLEPKPGQTVIAVIASGDA